MSGNKKYKAFISYSHQDRSWARWLHRKIEGYQVPRYLVGRQSTSGPIPQRLSPVFRDRDDLATAADLSAGIREALEASENLLVICSPAAVRSKYVNQEIETFKRLGRSDRVFCLIVSGDPAASDTDQNCFPPALRQTFDSREDELAGVAEPIAADVRHEGDGRYLARLKIIAGMLGVPLDDLRQRDLQRRVRRMAALTIASLAALAITVTLAVSAHLARQEAEQRRTQAENLLGFMVEDLRDGLEPLGRLDLLEKVGSQAMDYFATVNIRDLSDEELTRHAQVITQLGEIRTSERQYDEALEMFKQAFERSAELYRNNPEDGERLFNRGQAEFWVGWVYRRLGDLEEARIWLTRYLNSSIDLAGLDPSRQDWALEVVYGQHNLAVLALDAQDLDAARVGFNAEIEALQNMGQMDPGFDPRPGMADAYSWLGNIEFTAGNLGEALRNQSQAAALFEKLSEETPDDRELHYAWSHAANFVAIVHTLTGNRAQARQLSEQAIRVLDELVRHDQDNQEWLRSSAKPRITRAAIFAAEGSWTEANDLLNVAIETLEGMAIDGNADVPVHEALADALLLRAWSERETDDFDGARRSLDEVRAHIRAIDNLGAMSDERRGRGVTALVSQGEIQFATGDLDGARQTWQEALSELKPVSETTGSPYVLDPLARALFWTGQNERASNVKQKLSQHGYQPIRPWPRTSENGGQPL